MGYVRQADRGKVGQEQHDVIGRQIVFLPMLFPLGRVNGLAYDATVFRVECEPESFGDRAGLSEVVARHTSPCNHLQNHPWQLDSKQRSNEQEEWGCFFHELACLKCVGHESPQAYSMAFPVRILDNALEGSHGVAPDFPDAI
jgi:hypothetical protein